MKSFLNKERIVFLAGVGVFLIGIGTLLTQAPMAAEDPSIPDLPPPRSNVDVETTEPVFPTPPPKGPDGLVIDPFAKRDEWVPPRAGVLPDLPSLPAGYAIPRVSLETGIRAGVITIQTRPPEAAPAETPAEEGAEDEGVPEEEAG